MGVDSEGFQGRLVDHNGRVGDRCARLSCALSITGRAWMWDMQHMS